MVSINAQFGGSNLHLYDDSLWHSPGGSRKTIKPQRKINLSQDRCTVNFKIGEVHAEKLV
jgi:hypothetical protein